MLSTVAPTTGTGCRNLDKSTALYAAGVLFALCRAAAAQEGTSDAPLTVVWPALVVVGFNLALFMVWFFVKRLRAPADRGAMLRGGRTMTGAESHDTTLLPLAVTKAIDIIEQHYADELDASVLAREVRVKPGYLERLFRESTGKTIGEYLDSYRIERAAELLTTTELPLAEVHHRVGIHRLSRFARLFKQHTGRTPSEFIREHREDTGTE